jgi:hypothetical protein
MEMGNVARREQIAGKNDEMRRQRRKKRKTKRQRQR